jgi:hypothetical protein
MGGMRRVTAATRYSLTRPVNEHNNVELKPYTVDSVTAAASLKSGIDAGKILHWMNSRICA